jgi:hypothetical protein
MAIYFVLGVIIGSDQAIHGMSIKPVWLLVAPAVAGLMVSSLAGYCEGPDRAVFLPTITFAISGIIGVLALALLMDKARFGTAFQCLGRYSLEIYVIYTIATAGVRVALNKFAHISAPAPHLVLDMLAGLYSPIGLALLFKRAGFRFGFTLARSRRLDLIGHR